MKEVKPSSAMIEAAKLLNTGKLIFVYKDGSAIRCETEYGEDPYVWRNGAWKPMR